MDGYLCFNIYKGWMKSESQMCGSSQVCGSSKEVSAKRKRDKDEVEHVEEEYEAVSLLTVVVMQCLPD